MSARRIFGLSLGTRSTPGLLANDLSSHETDMYPSRPTRGGDPRHDAAQEITDDMHIKGNRILATLALGMAVVAMAPNAFSIAGEPAGNAGTIKIDGVQIDNLPDNDPHVGCEFEVDFYGYQADQVVTLTFETLPPTGRRLLVTKTKVLDGDGHAGGGSTSGWDGSKDVTLDGKFEPGDDWQPHQGYHVKLTVDAPGSKGADSKYKVFWVRGCSTNTDETSGNT